MDYLLDGLDPSGRDAARYLVAYARAAGIPVVVTSARRSLAQQKALTPAKGLYKASNPSQSRHVQGRAFDLSIEGFYWDEVDPAYWRWLGDVWKRLGGRWGGNFSKPDPIHFDW